MKKPTKKQAEESVKILLAYLGEDPNREGLLETPSRVVKSMREMCRGYSENPKKSLSKTFDTKDEHGIVYGDMIILKNIKFTSMCEHHLLPFVGVCSIAYIPSDRVVGVSKLVRLVNTFSKRMQIQERLTSQIANNLNKFLKPLGAGVLIDSTHHCMVCRGVEQHDTVMRTCSVNGVFKSDSKVRSEFMSHIS